MPDGRCDDDALRIRIAVPPALWINPHARISAKQGVRTGIERPALRPDRRQIGGERLLSLRRRALASLQHAQGYRTLRTEEGRGGKKCVGPCKTRGARNN